MEPNEATVSGRVQITLDGLVKTVSPTLGLTPRSEKVLTDISRKDERRDRFVRKKKFKKITSASKLKESKRKNPPTNFDIEEDHDQTIK